MGLTKMTCVPRVLSQNPLVCVLQGSSQKRRTLILWSDVEITSMTISCKKSSFFDENPNAKYALATINHESGLGELTIKHLLFYSASLGYKIELNKKRNKK